MQRILLSFLSVFCAAVMSAQQADTSRFSVLGEKLQEYYQTLKHESIGMQIHECDFLIESATDSMMRQYIALDIYRHYHDSSIMGAENVAVHVFDKWFGSGKIKMRSDRDMMDAQVYSDFNRNSLIGKKAPELRMVAIDGSTEELFTSDDPSGVFRVLFFYDTDCSKCRLETYLLKKLFEEKTYPIEFYAIYVGNDESAWKEYAVNLDAIHLWDPHLESDFQRKYGVVKTPRMFLISPDEIIIGRGLDAEALEILLDDFFAVKELSYGSRESEMLFDGIFSASAGRPDVEEVRGIADYIKERTLAQGDTLMFRQMAGDYLYYLSARSGEGFREGLKYHIESNIKAPAKVWITEDDSLKVLGFADIMYDLLSKSAPGSVISSVRVPAELYVGKRCKDVNMKLDRMKGRRNIIIFYTEGCEVCAAEKEAALRLLSDRNTKVMMVNVDRVMENDPALASRLMDTFDLSSLPYIILTDSHGTILRRYLSLQ